MFAAQEFVTPLKMTLIAETQMQGSKRQVVSRISIEGLQLREPFWAWMIVIADPPAVKDPGLAVRLLSIIHQLTRVRRRETSPGPGLGTCIYRAPGVPTPSKDVFNGVLAEVRQ